jgi:hypothetical protein
MSDKRAIISYVSVIAVSGAFIVLSVMEHARPTIVGILAVLLTFGVVVSYGLYNFVTIPFASGKMNRLKKQRGFWSR